jgi:type I restriction enzyme S subunit
MSKWKKYLLSELVEFNPDNLNKNYRYKEIFYLDISSVGEGFAEFNEPISLSKAPSRAKRLVLPNDTIIATVRPGNRSFYYFNKFPENTVVSTGFAVIRANEQKIDHRFLYYTITNREFTAFLVANEQGANYPAVTSEIIGRAEILLPPLPTQRRIGSILSAYDDLIENNIKRIKLLEETLQIILNKLSIDVDCKPTFIYPEIVDFVKGFEPGSNNYSEINDKGTIPFIRVSNLSTRESNLYISSELKGLKKTESDDILISMDGSIGIVSVGISGAYSSGIRKVVLKNKIFKGLIYSFLKSSNGQSQIMTFAKGSTILHASSCIPKLKVILPNEKKFKNELELSNSCLAQIIKLIYQNQRLNESRDILLPKLMNGTINIE